MDGVKSEVEAAAGVLEARDTPTYRRLGPKVWIATAIMVAMGAVTAVLMLRDFRSDSYFYLAFYAIPANSAISVFPHEPALIYYGKFANLWITAAAATAGTIVAGIMDHSVFVPVLNHEALRGYKEKPFYQKAIGYFMRWPFATLVVAGFTPIPFFPFKFLTFSIHYPMWKYLTALVVARYPRYYLLALVGATFPIPTWALVASFLFIISLYVIKAGPRVLARLRERR